MQRKKILAYLRNCSYRNLGMNVKIVYFPVEIELFLNLEIWVEFSRTFLVAALTCWFGMLLLELEEFGRNLK